MIDDSTARPTIDDAETVFEIVFGARSEYLPYALSPHTRDQNHRWVSNRLIPQHNVTIATVNGIDVGVIATSIDEEAAWIDQCYIAPGFVRQGIGSCLLQYALEKLPRPVRLWTFQQNFRAISFYRRFGFDAIQYTDGSGNEEKCPDVLFELNGT